MQIWKYSPPNSAGIRQLIPVIQSSILVLRGGVVNLDIIFEHEDREYPPVSPPDYKTDYGDIEAMNVGGGDDLPAPAPDDDDISPIGELVEDDGEEEEDDDYDRVEPLPGPARRDDEYLTFEGYEPDSADHHDRNNYFSTKLE